MLIESIQSSANDASSHPGNASEPPKSQKQASQNISPILVSIDTHATSGYRELMIIIIKSNLKMIIFEYQGLCLGSSNFLFLNRISLSFGFRGEH